MRALSRHRSDYFVLGYNPKQTFRISTSGKVLWGGGGEEYLPVKN